MSDYTNGKIYKLTSKQTDKIYVGSTTKILNQRMHDHRTKYKYNHISNISSCEILKYDDAIIELIEDYSCDSKTELEKREQHYMDFYKDIIVNIKNTTQFCEHNKVRYTCKECHGSGICEHNKHKTICIECRGALICEHLKRRYICKICNNIKICIGITRNKTPCKCRAKPDSDYCGKHTPK